MKSISLDDAINRDIGEIGTPERDKFEEELKAEIEKGEAMEVISHENAVLHLANVTVSLPSREEYDNRQLKPMYFTKDTSVGNSVLYIKGDQYDPYNWNYSRMIDYLKEGRIGYAR